MYSGISDTNMSWKQDRQLDNMHSQPSFHQLAGCLWASHSQLETFHVCGLAGFIVRMKTTGQTSEYWVESALWGEDRWPQVLLPISSSSHGRH